MDSVLLPLPASWREGAEVTLQGQRYSVNPFIAATNLPVVVRVNTIFCLSSSGQDSARKLGPSVVRMQPQLWKTLSSPSFCLPKTFCMSYFGGMGYASEYRYMFFASS